MISSVTSFGKNGVQDWLVQRVSAVIVAVYSVFLIGYICVNSHNLDYDLWVGLYSNRFMQILTIFFVLSLVLHAWIGLWSVFTDYVKISSIRIILEVLVILVSIFYLIWSIQIFWSL
tara:strand:+ start:26056 stop:26406 length:351 start_codon:yes stop_codon:yes gene_type:complete